MLNFRRLVPTLNRVLIKKVEPVTKSKGGILLPESKIDNANYGEVVATGPGVYEKDGKLRACLVKQGDTVLLPEWGGSKIKLADDKEYVIYKDEDLLGTLHDEVKH